MLNHVYIFFSTVPYLKNKRLILLSIIKNTDKKLFDYSDLRWTQILLFGDILFDVHTNLSTLNATIDFVTFSKIYGETANSFFSAVTIFDQNLFCILFPFILIFLEHYNYFFI